ncbi:cap-specific mRNA (nucleoside-2'-O-)-methyltransferase 2 [Sabethes cyaneus]|uniref:cap-specific mRNA (nucleoside-2'-O-)-methyltransferase 2 n=1 Tax=Sabethes cyaneus TaxID=53552 RepID=UPI00237E7377|nr:cap-specific mRNA (nucleoside-2'-O-)-methyltransferase 2 [Sabethes cyaneus]
MPQKSEPPTRRRSSHRRSSERISICNRRDVEKDIEEQFSKKFQFSALKSEIPMLPPLDTVYSGPPYFIEVLQKVKNDLNAVKNRLNDFEISHWHQHTRNRSSLLPILHELRHRIGGEFVTQAFAKLYECVAAYELVPRDRKELFSVHLCEAPGAFITGLNHYLQLNRKGIRWQWFANTLNPYYEGNCLGNMITDDRFIYHTLDSWCFGEDFTGDVMKRANLDAIVRRSKQFREVNLVTADGSIDCLDIPEAQEEHVSHLHLAEAVTALKILTVGGSLILKMFTLFEHCSVNLLYLLYVCFEQLNVFKPCTSKPGNSEVYIIAKGFRPPEGIDRYLNRIFDNLYSENAMFDRQYIPDDFIEQVHRCSYDFMAAQQNVIEHNIHFYRRKDEQEDLRLKHSKQQMCRAFFETYSIKPIRPTEMILNGVDIANGMVNINPRDNSGTYNERSSMSSLSGEQRMNMLRERLENLVQNMPIFLPRSRLTDRPLKRINSCIETLSLTSGKPIKRLQSSKFIAITYLRFLMEVIELATVTCTPNSESTLITFDRSSYILTISIEEYATIADHDSYEKYLFQVLFKCIEELPLEESVDHLVVENWLLLTQFSVGLVFLLKTFVFEQIERTSPTKLKFSGLKPDGIASMQYLNEALQSEQNRCAPTKSVFGLVPIPLLFDGGFYYAVINYNVSLCLRYCEQLLGKWSTK